MTRNEPPIITTVPRVAREAVPPSHNDARRPTHSHHDAPSKDSRSEDPTSHTQHKKASSGYVPALDGLRAFAVLAVVLYHMDSTLLPSGLLGVTIFFVLSGYLITGILIKEWKQKRSINLPRFWIHRVRRLFPAIVFMLTTSLVFCAFLSPELLTKLRNDLFAALFWFTNWWYIFQDVSYFEAAGAPSPVTHFWSLAIEEQFYLVWPPLLLLLFKCKVKKRPMEIIILVLAVISVVLMGVLYEPGGDPSRVYYGTDTRAFSLLVGAFLAFACPMNKVCGKGRDALDPHQRKILGYLGAGSFIALIVLMAVINAYSPVFYYGGLLAVSLLSGLLMLALVDPNNSIAKAFSMEWMLYLGRISYGVYLWHYPIILLTTNFNDPSAVSWIWHLFQFALTLGVSAFSYHFVEQPIRSGCLGRMFAAVKTHATTLADLVRTHIVQVASTVILVAGATIACIVVPPTTALENPELLDGSISGNASNVLSESDIADLPQDASAKEFLLAKLGPNPVLPNLSLVTLDQLANTPGATAEEQAENTDFLLIGDSVTAIFAYADKGYGSFDTLFPNATLDSQKNRAAIQGARVMKEHLDAGWDGPVVIFELGTNITSTQSQIDDMLNAVPEGKLVFLVNVRAPGDTQSVNNIYIQNAVASHSNVELIDWFEESAMHADWFDGDGTHLNREGTEAYQNMILRTLETLYKNRQAEGSDEDAEGAQGEGDANGQAESSASSSSQSSDAA